MFVFSFIDENNIEHNHQILVYDSTKNQYDELISALPELFKEFGIEEEIIAPKQLDELVSVCKDTYFDNNMIPSYNKRDIEYLLKYFAQKESVPLFVPFEEIDRKKVDLSLIAKEIYEKDLRTSERTDLINTLWNDESSLISIYFGNKYFFKSQLEIELDKIQGLFEYAPEETEITYEQREIASLPLSEICEKAPDYGNNLKAEIFETAKTVQGEYKCANCRKTSSHKALYQISHITPMSEGGLTKPDNLQLLCSICSQKKVTNDDLFTLFYIQKNDDNYAKSGWLQFQNVFNPLNTSVSTNPYDIKNIENMLELTEDNKDIKNMDCGGKARVVSDTIWIWTEEKPWWETTTGIRRKWEHIERSLKTYYSIHISMKAIPQVKQLSGVHTRYFGRASDWQSDGQRFDPSYLHQKTA